MITPWLTLALYRSADWIRERLPEPRPCDALPLFDATSWEALLGAHPAGRELRRLFSPGVLPLHLKEWRLTGVTSSDYLCTVARQVDFWKTHQDIRGAIVDPYERRECQYATPAFAMAGASLVAFAGRLDLKDNVARAIARSCEDLAERTTADQHPDFYIALLLQARRWMRTHADESQVQDWDRQLRRIRPHRHYRDRRGWANWAVLNLCGEAMRAKDGLVASQDLRSQKAYRRWLRRCRSHRRKGVRPSRPWLLSHRPFFILVRHRLLADGKVSPRAKVAEIDGELDSQGGNRPAALAPCPVRQPSRMGGSTLTLGQDAVIEKE